jgi:hypothetical protein
MIVEGKEPGEDEAGGKSEEAAPPALAMSTADAALPDFYDEEDPSNGTIAGLDPELEWTVREALPAVLKGTNVHRPWRVVLQELCTGLAKGTSVTMEELSTAPATKLLQSTIRKARHIQKTRQAFRERERREEAVRQEAARAREAVRERERREEAVRKEAVRDQRRAEGLESDSESVTDDLWSLLGHRSGCGVGGVGAGGGSGGGAGRLL